MLCVCADLAPAVAEVLPSLRRCGVSALLLFGGCETDGIVNLSAAVRAASEEAPPLSLRRDISIRSPALYIYTSGTTGEFSHSLRFVREVQLLLRCICVLQVFLKRQ